MVFIAYNYEGKIISIVNALSKQIAMAYWQGAGISVDSSKCLDDENDFMPLKDHPTGVYPILKTVETDGYQINQNKREAKYIIIK